MVWVSMISVKRRNESEWLFIKELMKIEEFTEFDLRKKGLRLKIESFRFPTSGNNGWKQRPDEEGIATFPRCVLLPHPYNVGNRDLMNKGLRP